MRKKHNIQRGSGIGRSPWPLRDWIEKKGLTVTGVADMAEVKCFVVSHTLRGYRNHGRVLVVLEALGCPKKLLYPHEYGDAERAA